jgi:hypothetical protein
LRNIACNNPNCLYLHSLARDDDCFSKEDLAATERLNPVYSHSDRDVLEEEVRLITHFPLPFHNTFADASR